jgi:hypothetical protein
MDLVAAALAGVVVGAFIASAVMIRVHQRRADRDWLERQIRACMEYRECLGDLEEAFDGADGDPAILEQAWANVAAFSKECRRTGWLFEPAMRSSLSALVLSLEEEEKRWRLNGAGSGQRAAQVLSEKCRELDRLLLREVERAVREFRRPRSREEGNPR